MIRPPSATDRADRPAGHPGEPGITGGVRRRPEVAAQVLITTGRNPNRLRSEPSVAALCAPVPASSGKTRRYRLSRGGDRHANSALHRIALVRMSSHQPTIDYVHRQTAQGQPKKQALRMLRRAITREIYRYLTQPCPVPEWADLRPAREAKNLRVTAAAQHFGVWPTVISRLERGLQRNDNLTTTCRAWLAAA